VPLLDDREPIVLVGLEKWTVGDRLLTRIVGGEDVSAALESVEASGALPPGKLGHWAYAAIEPQVIALGAMRAALASGKPLPPLDVDVTIAGLRIQGVLEGLWPRAQIRHQFSQLGRGAEVRFWIRHLLLLFHNRPGYPRTTVIVGREGENPAVCRFHDVAEPEPVLASLARLYLEGQEAPLALPPNAARAYAEAIHGGAHQSALGAARKAFEQHGTGFADLDNVYVAQVYAEHDAHALDARFEATALALFAPLLAHRTVDLGVAEP
jgi:exodeoxyribonuclease V gamma subunit